MLNIANSNYFRYLILSIGVYLLVGCGSDYDDNDDHEVTGYNFKLSISGSETLSLSDPPYYQNWLDSEGRWYLEGDGFLPLGSTCITRTCRVQTPFWGPYESAHIGQHELTWKNETTGASGIISKGSKFESHLSWLCYCERPPQWFTYVPVVPGPNRIVVTQQAGNIIQQDKVLVIRE